MSDGLRISDLDSVFKEIYDALPEPKFMSAGSIPADLPYAYRVSLGGSAPSTTFVTMKQDQISLVDTIYVDFVCQCHHEDSNLEVLRGRRTVIQAVLDIDQPELSFQGAPEPEVFEGETQQVVARTQWDLEYCIDINPTYD